MPRLCDIQYGELYIDRISAAYRWELQRTILTRLSAIRDSEKNRNILKSYTETPGLEIVWGDLKNYDDVLKCVKG